MPLLPLPLPYFGLRPNYWEGTQPHPSAENWIKHLLNMDKLPHVRGQGQRLRVPGCDGTGTDEKSYPSPSSGVAAGRSYPTSKVRGSAREDLPRPPCQRPGAAARRSYPKPEARGSSREDQPHVQGAVAAQTQEGLEELSHVEGQKGRR